MSLMAVKKIIPIDTEANGYYDSEYVEASVGISHKISHGHAESKE